MIEFNINGNKYTYEQFKKDMTRMFDSVRSNNLGEANCMSVKCDDCPLRNNACPANHEYDFYEYFYENISEALKYVKAVFKWAQEHPIKTNFDKLEEVFGVEVAEYIITDGKQKTREYKFSNKENKTIRLNSLSLEDTSFSEWLDEKYKEEKQNEEHMKEVKTVNE